MEGEGSKSGRVQRKGHGGGNGGKRERTSCVTRVDEDRKNLRGAEAMKVIITWHNLLRTTIF